LRALAKGPELKTGLQEKTHLTENMLRTALKKLISLGFAEESGEVGNKRKVYAITAKGKNKAVEMGIKAAAFKSGPIHEVVVRETMLSLSKCIKGCSFQRSGITFNGVQLDALMLFPGKYQARCGIQAICSNNYAREANCIRRLSEVEALEFVVAVCLNSTTKKLLDKHLKDIFGGHVHGKIRCVDFETVCDSKFDWEGEFGA